MDQSVSAEKNAGKGTIKHIIASDVCIKLSSVAS